MRNQPNHVAWPSNEFMGVAAESSTGYMSKCFPCLFPDGAGEYCCDPPRAIQMSFYEYNQHLLRLDNGRFLQDQRYIFTAFNITERKRIRQKARIFIDSNSTDISLDDVQTMIETNDLRLHDRILRFNRAQKGTAAFFTTKYFALKAMIEQLGTPHLFVTLTAADAFWPEFEQLLFALNRQAVPVNETASAMRQRRKQMLQQYQGLADVYFHHRVDSYIKLFLAPVLGVVDWFVRFEWQHRGSPHAHGLFWVKTHEKFESDLDRTICELNMDYIPDQRLHAKVVAFAE